MSTHTSYDAIIVGSGPNGLAAAITLAKAGRSVLVIEAKKETGGGLRSAELTLPGFTHDICSAIHPLCVASPFFTSLPLAEHGLEWVHPSAPLAHPLDDGTSVILERSVALTAWQLGQDRQSYGALLNPLVANADPLMKTLLGPIRWPKDWPGLMRFSRHALRSARGLAMAKFKGERAQSLLAGLAGHSVVPLHKTVTASFALVLGVLAHKVGWPFPRGGSERIAQAMVEYFKILGGEIITGMQVETIDQLPSSKAVLFDVTPKQLIRIAGHKLPEGYKRKLRRFRHGPGVFKIDLALDAPIPWHSRDCSRAATVHLGGTLGEIALSERAVWNGEHSDRPFVILAQHSLFDTTRAPEGKHTVWAYCHVPHGSSFDMSDRIEAQIERFAPGFRDLILARHTMSSVQMESYNPNYIGGDITGGANMFGQLIARPVLSLSPYSTPAKNIFICSASTPPGGGVHGMCGYHAAKAVLSGPLA